ncbi:ligase-associated DNA damage response endonuclease PdeM [Xylophilus rhododendri]|uniref:Ligase-associated DNA damage response endonuclease PdeM n=1 Tax=Xylophilus rhododendri TaxID=2697032 RepID=A0A857J794_9BURK|nr:ligase-associated DNA damage response endonuclease PdeM [Xylophilus rhododendri]QHI99113.1 ligase-associated DNA damage response endonuclease PdeM [Xylophilus rhododendri]
MSDLILAGEAVQFLPDPALWWPAGGTLFVADLHIGKAAVFRARGLPVPSGTTRINLDRLSSLLSRHAARRLVVLGDFLHARESRTPSVLTALQAWRLAHAAVEMVLVRGNHDSHAGDPPASLGIAVVDEPWSAGPFACCHHPQLQPGRHVLAGHVHPAVRLRGTGRDALRLPCFSTGAGLTLLPAFGDFTGSHVLAPETGRLLFAVGGGRVWPVPASTALPA